MGSSSDNSISCRANLFTKNMSLRSYAQLTNCGCEFSKMLTSSCYGKNHVPVKIVHKALLQITYAQRANIDMEADPSTTLCNMSSSVLAMLTSSCYELLCTSSYGLWMNIKIGLSYNGACLLNEAQVVALLDTLCIINWRCCIFRYSESLWILMYGHILQTRYSTRLFNTIILRFVERNKIPRNQKDF